MNKEQFKKPIAFRRLDDGELFTINEDGFSYSLEGSKKAWPNHLHSKFNARHLPLPYFEPIYNNTDLNKVYTPPVTKFSQLWEILVPTIIDGKPVRTRYHKVWDAKIRKISKGLTILTPAKGQWISKEGELFEERMIPVRISCTEDEIRAIMDITAKYYKQKAVMAYLVSDKVMIKDY